MISKIGPGQFRLILALLVVVEHLSRLQVGKVAVMVFFMLSGYWVTKVYLQKYSKLTQGVFAFYVSRFLRIWPMYFFAFCVAFLIANLMGVTSWADVYMAIPILGIATHGIDLTNVSWSLDIELQFYFILPFLLLVFGKAKNKAQGLGFAILLLGLSVTGWVLSQFYGIHTALLYLPLFAAGAGVHIFDFTVRRKTAIWSVLAFFVFAAAMYIQPDTRSFIIGGSGATLNDKLFALVWALFLVAFVAFNVRQVSSNLDRHMGNLSYTVYLLHFPIINLTRHLLDRDLVPFEKILFLPVMLFLCILAYILIDMRLEKLRKSVNRQVAKLSL